MAGFTGMTVQVTLKDSTNTLLRGVVKEVVAGQTLMLQNVFFPITGARWDHWTIQSSAIGDVQVVEANAPSLPTKATRMDAPPPSALPSAAQATQRLQPAQSPLPAQVPVRSASGQAQQAPSSFVDPAILSFDRSPAPTIPAAQLSIPSTPKKSALAQAAESLPKNNSPFVGEAGKSNGSYQPAPTNDMAKLGLGVQQEVLPSRRNAEVEASQGTTADGSSRKKIRRGLKKKGSNAVTDPPPIMNTDVSRHGNDMDGNGKGGKGWRQTPLLQPLPQKASDKKMSRRQREKAQEVQQNGWATEDATDIQDLGDFDFEANHKLFDKKQVFDQLRQDDTTADEDRLVSHNKLPRPGTYGGKNLHPTENVLSPQLGPKYHSNEVDSSSDADTELNAATGRSSSRHSVTRNASMRQPSRQNSALQEGKPHPLATSFSSDRDVPLCRSMTSLTGKGSKLVPSILTASPRPDRMQSPTSAASATRSHGPSIPVTRTREPRFVLHPTMSPCPVLLPNALETLEYEAVARYGLSPEAITETAARYVAEMAINMFDYGTSGRRDSRSNAGRSATLPTPSTDRDVTPVIVIIAGNNATGARATAAARQLVCRKTRIIIVEALYESADAQDTQMKTQIALLKRMIKGGASIKRGPWRRASGYIKNLAGPPAVIVDAFLAGSTYESLLDTSNTQHAFEAQKEAREIVDWANRSRAPVLSIGCPSGVSGTDGLTTTVEGEPLAIRPDQVLALGLPMQGLLAAEKNGENWDVSVADIGINIMLRSEEAVAFGPLWVAHLKFVNGDGVSEM